MRACRGFRGKVAACGPAAGERRWPPACDRATSMGRGETVHRRAPGAGRSRRRGHDGRRLRGHGRDDGGRVPVCGAGIRARGRIGCTCRAMVCIWKILSMGRHIHKAGSRSSNFGARAVRVRAPDPEASIERVTGTARRGTGHQGKENFFAPILAIPPIWEDDGAPRFCIGWAARCAHRSGWACGRRRRERRSFGAVSTRTARSGRTVMRGVVIQQAGWGVTRAGPRRRGDAA